MDSDYEIKSGDSESGYQALRLSERDNASPLYHTWNDDRTVKNSKISDNLSSPPKNLQQPAVTAGYDAAGGVRRQNDYEEVGAVLKS